MVWPVSNAVTLAEQFAEVATTDPLSALLLLVGAALTAFASGVFGLLAAGAVVGVLTPDRIGRAPPPRE
jgi:hypothetical protein